VCDAPGVIRYLTYPFGFWLEHVSKSLKIPKWWSEIANLRRIDNTKRTNNDLQNIRIKLKI